MADADQETEYTRVICVQTCGPSPTWRCLYRAGLIYNANAEDATWLLSNGFAYEEGDMPILPPIERAKIAIAQQRVRDMAADRAALLAAREARAEEAAAEEHAMVIQRDERVAALLAARAAGKKAQELPEATANELSLARAARAAEEAEEAAIAAERQEAARLALIEARRTRNG